VGNCSSILANEHEELVFAENEFLEVYSRPQLTFSGFLSTVIGVRTKDSSHNVVWISSLLATGDLHQTWVREPDVGIITVPTPYRVDLFEFDIPTPPLPLPEIAIIDSHVIPLCDVEVQCRGVAGEVNDGFNRSEIEQDFFGTLDGRIDNFSQIYGIGALQLVGNILFKPEHLSDSVELAYLVTPWNNTYQGSVELELWARAIDAEGHSLQDLRMLTTSVPYFLPNNSDLNGDGRTSHEDIDALLHEIRTSNRSPVFDLTDDGRVDLLDVEQWLTLAATENGFAEPYRYGDANLDGIVDALDLNTLALNWQENVALWSGGDFTADGIVNSADLNGLALNWRQSIPISSDSAPVPEPSALLLTVVGLALAWRRSRCS
jgi:hypothetical protein